MAPKCLLNSLSFAKVPRGVVVARTRVNLHASKIHCESSHASISLVV